MPSGIAALQAVDPDLDAAPGLLVAKTVEPLRKNVRLSYLDKM